MNNHKKSFLFSFFESASGTLFSRISGFLRDIVTARCYGTENAHMALFLAAFKFTSMLRRIISERGLHEVFIPHYKEHTFDNNSKKLFFTKTILVLLRVVFYVLLILYIIIALLFIISNNTWLSNIFFSISDTAKETCLYIILMSPSLIFISLFGINTAVQYSHRNFFIPNVSQIAFNISWMLGVWLFSRNKFDNTYPIYTMQLMSLSIIYCYFTQWLVTYWPLRKCTKRS